MPPTPAPSGSAPRASSLGRAVRSYAGKFMRRHGLLPGGMTDGLGDDEKLLGSTLPYEVMVFFADTLPAVYQIEQWYESFRALNEVHPVGVFVRDSRVAQVVREGSGLPVHTIAHFTTIDDLLSRSPIQLALYVNHHPENFSNLAFGQLVHASMMHGDSDKTVTVSNQTKAYDFSLVAGQAAIDRMARYTMFYDAESRCIPIGRPQIDRQLAEMTRYAANREPDSPPTVLYAPSWEDAQASSAYGSTESHGVPLVRSLLDAGRFRVIYRPHPLTGVRLASYGDADAAIRSLIDEAAAGSSVGHRTDTTIDIAQSFGESDLMICDISGVAIDWLPSGKPLIITVPAGAQVQDAETALTRLAPRLPVAALGDVVELIDEQLRTDPTLAGRTALTDYYLGDVTPGAATARFLTACNQLLARRREELERMA